MTDAPSEAILEPDLPIVDPHHHLWDLRAMVPHFPQPHHPFIAAIAGAAHYTFDQLLADVGTGHNVVGTIFMECGAFYRAEGNEALKSVGEVEYVNGVAAQSASGLYGPLRACAGIVGYADLQKAGEVAPVLDILMEAGNDRFRGIRNQGAWDADPDVLGPPFHAPAGLYRDTAFREGFGELAKRDLTFDAWVLEPQLDDVIDLARAFPDQPIILDHCGSPVGIASYSGKLIENFDRWRNAMRALAKCENVSVKLGGLAMAFCGMPQNGPAEGCGSKELAAQWKPYIDTCIDAFGTKRAMFESNYPVDRWGATYPVLWNAFKRIASGASDSEKRDLFSHTAARTYGVENLLQ
ncbi:MAG: amidohydrolase family protein [Pontixanthobacter sp.]